MKPRVIFMFLTLLALTARAQQLPHADRWEDVYRNGRGDITIYWYTSRPFIYQERDGDMRSLRGGSRSCRDGRDIVTAGEPLEQGGHAPGQEQEGGDAGNGRKEPAQRRHGVRFSSEYVRNRATASKSASAIALRNSSPRALAACSGLVR